MALYVPRVPCASGPARRVPSAPGPARCDGVGSCDATAAPGSWRGCSVAQLRSLLFPILPAVLESYSRQFRLIVLYSLRKGRCHARPPIVATRPSAQSSVLMNLLIFPPIFYFFPTTGRFFPNPSHIFPIFYV